LRWSADLGTYRVNMQASDAREPRHRNIERPGWRLKLPATPLHLDDSRLLDYRHPAERPMLGWSLVTLAALLVAVAVFEKKEVVLAVLGVWLSMILTSLQATIYNTLRGAEVTPSQFPAIYQIVQELCQRFQMPPTRVFIYRKLSVETEIFVLRVPHVIALPSLLLDSLEPGQLRYVLGQAMGRIRFCHPLMEILLGGDESALPTVLSWVARIRDLVFAGYRRAQVLSADRIGVLAAGSVVTAIEVQTKLSVGTVQMREVRADDLIDQAYRLTRGVSRLQAKLIALQSTTPPLIYRLEAMVEWAGLPSREQVDEHASNVDKQIELEVTRNKGDNV
jgi:hypothetical protein